MLLCYLACTELPVWTALAAPGLFVRPGAGVSRLPLEVLAFDTPGFGEVSDAINLASGNLYLDAGDVTRNSKLESGDETSGSFGVNWHYAPRLRLAGFSKTMTSGPTSFALYAGDGGGETFNLVSAVDWASAPSWVQRYQSVGTARVYRRAPEAGTQRTDEWIVLNLRANNAVAHYYSPDGRRTSFHSSGDLADYSQDLHQQHRAAVAGRPEGDSGAEKTDYQYSSGRLSRVQDEYGRTTDYVWNTDGTLARIDHLLGGSGGTTPARQVTFGYGTKTVGTIAHKVVNAVTYSGPNGRGGTAARTVQFTHDVQTVSQRIVVNTVYSKVLDDGGLLRVTDYDYDDQDRVVKVTRIGGGEPVTTYTYAGSGTAGGRVAARTVTPESVRVPSPNPHNATASFAQYAPAAGGSAAYLRGNGAAAVFRAPSDLPAGTYTVRVRVTSDNYPPYPHLRLSRDGTTPLGATIGLDDRTFNERSFGVVDIQPGASYHVTVVADPDDPTPPTDRIAVVDHLVLERGPTGSAAADEDPQMYVQAEAVGESGAQGGSAVALYNNDARATFRLPPGLAGGNYELKLRGRSSLGAARPADVRLSVGGTSATTSLNTDGYTTKSFGTFTLHAGQSVDVAFTNDYYGGAGQDLNALVDYLSFEGASGAGARVTVTQGADLGDNRKETVHLLNAGRLVGRRVWFYNPDADGEPGRYLEWRYAYHGDGSTAAVVEPTGKTTLYGYDVRGNLNRESVFRTPPADSALTTDATGWLRKRTFAYDNDNRLVSEVTPALSGTGYSYAKVESKHVYTDYVPTGAASGYRATQKVHHYTQVNDAATPRYRDIREWFDKNGRRETLERVLNEAAVSQTFYGYNATAGATWDPPLPSTSTDPEAAGTKAGTTAPAVKRYGDLVETSTTGTDVREYRYDALGNVAQEAHRAAFQADSVAKERWIRRSYNAFGQRVWEATTSKTSTGTSEEYVAKRMWDYYDSGEPVSSWEGSPKNVTQHNHYLDARHMGRVWKTRRGAGSGGSVATARESVIYAYDDYGRVASADDELDRLADGSAAPATATRYDNLDRVVREDRPDGGRTHTRYHTSGAPSETTVYEKTRDWLMRALNTVDELGRATVVGYTSGGSTTTTFDPFDRPLKVQDDRLDMNTYNTDTRASYLAYDSLGRLTKELGPALRTAASSPYTDSRRPYAEYGYDELGRRTRVTRLLNGSVSPSSLALPAGQPVAITQVQYDGLDRPTKVTSPDDSPTDTANPTGYATTRTYDNSGNPTSETREVWRTGDPLRASLANGFDSVTTRWTYDALGRVTSTADPEGDKGKTAYDLLGNVVTQMNERGFVTHVFGYTDDGLLERVAEPNTDPDPNTLPAVPTGMGTGGAAPAGYSLTKVYEYGNRPFPTALRVAVMGVSAGANTHKTEYSYDHAGRVVGAKLPQDKAGNRPTVVSLYDTSGNLVETKDAEGFTTRYAYDAANRVTSEHRRARGGNAADTDAGLSGGLASSYSYDWAGNLTVKIEGGLATHYHYNSLGKVIAESRPAAGTGQDQQRRLRTYRLDGELTAETTYDYADNNALPGMVATVSASNLPAVTAGNITAYDLGPRGKRLKEVSRGVSSASGGSSLQEHEALLDHDGLGQRVRRRFTGSAAIYTTVPRNDGHSSGAASYHSFRKYHADGRLHKSWDTLPDGTNTRNEFTYEYSPTGKEKKQTRRVVVKGRADGWHGDLNNGFTVAATDATVTTGYDERDQLATTVVDDKGVQDINGLQQVTRTTTHEYHLDGRKKKATVAGVGTQEYTEYDQRGRLVESLDSNGSGYGGPTNTTTTREYGTDGTETVYLTESGAYRHVEKTTPTVGGLVRERRVWDMAPHYGRPGQTLAVWPNEPSESTTYAYTVDGRPVTAGGSGLSWAECSSTGLCGPGPANGSTYYRQPSSTTTRFEYDPIHGHRAKTITDTSIIQELTGLHPIDVRVEDTPGYSLAGDLGARVVSTRTREYPGTTSTTTEEIYYNLDSRGNRTEMRVKVDADPPSWTLKRYDAEGRMEEFTPAQSGDVYPATVFAYDPFGAQILAAKITFNRLRHSSNAPHYRIDRRVISVSSVEGETQAIAKGEGPSGKLCLDGQYGGCEYTPYPGSSHQVKDETFGLSNGILPYQDWDVVGDFDAAAPGPAARPLEAPQAPLSTQLGLDPLAVRPPAPATPPSLGDKPIAPPSTATGAATASAKASSATGTVGLSAAPALQPLVPLGALPGVGPPAKQDANKAAEPKPAAGQGLQAPASALPPALSGTNAADVQAPKGTAGPALPPSVGDPGRVTAPGAATPPSVGTTPSEGPGTVKAPASVSGPPVPPIAGAPGGAVAVRPPAGWKPAEAKGDIRAFGGVYERGKCVYHQLAHHCKSPEDLAEEEKRLENDIKNATDEGERAAKEVELARIHARVAARKLYGGNDVAADGLVDRLTNSALYGSLNPNERLALWVGLTGQASRGRLERRDLEAMVYGAERRRVRRGPRGEVVDFDVVEPPKPGVKGDPSGDVMAAGTTIPAPLPPRVVPGYAGLAIAVLALLGMAGSADSDPRATEGWRRFLEVINAGAGILRSQNEDGPSKTAPTTQTSSTSTSASPDPQDPCGPFPNRGKWRDTDTLAQHFDDHGSQVKAVNEAEYAQKAGKFFERARTDSSLKIKVGSDGSIRIFEPSTGRLGVYDPDGSTRSYFTPDKPKWYWENRVYGKSVSGGELWGECK